MLDVKKIRKDFKFYEHNLNMHYLDNAASTLKCVQAVNKMDDYLNNNGSNVHRGVYRLSYEATKEYEEARESIAKFINASFSEIVFTRGCSQALNLVASSYGLANINEGDEVITSYLEHHSSHTPWINVCKKKKAILKYIELDNNRITVENFKKVLTTKTKVVAITHVSNVLGYITPLDEIIKLAHEVGAIVVVDGAQSVPHMKVDVKALDCDFYAFSGHKMCGPTGVGVLYGKYDLLSKMEPIEFGGDMAEDVYEQKMTYKDAPYRFETGTPMIAEVLGLAESAKYLEQIGFDNICQHEKYLTNLAIEKMKEIDNLIIYNKDTDTGVISFNIKGVHPHDAASVFDEHDVCLRAGHHCSQLITRHLKSMGTLRISFYIYNDEEDVLAFINALKVACDFFKMFS